MPDKDPDVRAAIIHSIKLIRNWTIILFLSVIMTFSFALYTAAQQRHQLEHEAQRTIGALCTFRADLQKRYDDGVAFLADNPDGIPGLPAATIQRSLDAQHDTLISLANLPC